LKKLFILLNIIVFHAFVLHAQRMPEGGPVTNAGGVIKGQVLEAGTNQPMEYVNIVLFKAGDSTMVTGTVTSVGGSFELTQVPVGKYYIIARFIGYDNHVVDNVLITRQQPMVDLGSIELHAASANLKGVEVVADKEHVVYQLDKKVVNVSQDLQAAGGTAIEALENIPSVQVDVENNVTLRGSPNFTLLIDGRPSVLDNSDALQQIPASAIDRIEIITNPSAKYDPDGTAGIINVIMKKEVKTGLNGIVNVSAGTGDKYRSNVLLNYRLKKINFNLGGDYGSYRFNGHRTSYNETYLNDTTRYRNTTSQMSMKRHGYNITGGLDYFLSDKTTLSLSGRVGQFAFGRDNPSHQHIYTFPVTTNDYSLSNYNFDRSSDFYTGTLNVQHKFNDKGHMLEGMVFYSRRTGIEDQDQYDYQTDSNWVLTDQNPIFNRTREDDHSHELRIKVDYTLPIGEKGSFQAGYQSRIYEENGTYLFQNYNYTLGSWSDNELYSSAMDFKDDIHSLYAMYANEWLGFEYQIGLRGEYTYRWIKDIKSTQSYTLNMLDPFPTIHLSRQLPLNQQILASYSRRVNRPRGWDLDPFPNYIDPYNIRIGNPELKPEYVDSYELNYQKKFKDSYVALDAYYRITKNKITHISTLRDDGIMIQTNDNLNKDYSLGAELSTNLILTKWLELFGSFDLYHYRLVGTISDEHVDNRSLNWESQLNATVKLPGDVRLQWTNSYEGPSATAQGTEQGSFRSNLAARKDFLKRKLSVTLSGRDIFKTAKHESTSSGDGFYEHDLFTREAPVITLTLGYKINNYKKQPEKTNNSEEQAPEEEFNF
jgi:outer membrane receptor protein involved in Fe transport